MTDDTSLAPSQEPGGELVAHEIAHVARSGGGAPEAEPNAEPEADDATPGDQVPDVLESAAELGLGAVIAPFTGGETVSIIGSVASMFEAGVDRLTHLGEHESEPEADAGDAGAADAGTGTDAE